MVASRGCDADVVLRDGSTAHVRPVCASDAEALRVLFAGLSERSRYLRFFSAFPSLDAVVGWATAASRIDNMVAEFPNVKAWLERVRSRPAVAKGLETGKELRETQGNTPQAQEMARKVLFGQRGR